MDDIYQMPDISVKRTVVNGKVMEMVEYDEFTKDPERYLCRSDIGIVVHRDTEEDDIVIPLRNSYNGNPISPGVYNAGCIDFWVLPDATNEFKYKPEKIVELSNKMDAKQIIESGETIDHLDEPFILSSDDVTLLNIRQEDEPEMIALKQAINAKHMDLDMYSNRFGPNYPNDKRQLRGNSVTLNIIKRFCKNLDMEAELTIRDKNADVPNPMGKEVTISLTDYFVEE